MKQLSTMLWLLFLAAIGYLAIVLMLYLLQNSLMYYPAARIDITPAAIGLEYEDVRVETQDGFTIHGWFVEAPDARGTVLFSHGNAGNISGRLETIRLLHELDMNVLIYDYRGYGKSEGKTNEAGTYRDALAAWDFLVQQKDLSESRIVIMGRSLGGSVSAWLAMQKAPAALILESTFTSAGDLAQELYPWVPVRWLLRAGYFTEKYLHQVSVPVLILHSRDDQLIPFHHGKELYQAASEPKHFFEMNGDHGESHVVSGAGYIETLDKFFDEVLTDTTTNQID